MRFFRPAMLTSYDNRQLQTNVCHPQFQCCGVYGSGYQDFTTPSVEYPDGSHWYVTELSKPEPGMRKSPVKIYAFYGIDPYVVCLYIFFYLRRLCAINAPTLTPVIIAVRCIIYFARPSS